MAISLVFDRLRSVLFILLGIIKRALCCFRRRRRTSCDPIPLTAVGVVPNIDTSAADEHSCPDVQTWNSWDDTPSSIITDHSQPKNIIQEQIENYRQKNRYTSEDVEPQPDFFQDMAPKITKQPKIILKNEADISNWKNTVPSRLTMDAVSFTSADLETWEETPGWEDQAQEDWDPDKILREKRQLERQRRQAELQQKRLEREQMKLGRPVTLGARIS